MSRTLYLLRHAKSSWDDPSLPDRERPLAPRGRRACELIASYLDREHIAPELLLCSSATRSRETLERAGLASRIDSQILIEDGLYVATAADLLARLRLVDDEVALVLLVGHHPAIQDLAVCLASGGEKRGDLARKFPTAALATLTWSGGWASLGPAAAELVAFVTPRELASRPR
ncbi:MAG: histidine phosphatase family protein [Actinobacteria bacterium]|nr:histidine phosphatase family protein [Actinomycetota bacterium]